MSKEIILIMGYPASGKTVLAKEYKSQGYYRINRDELGGSLNDLVLHVARQYANSYFAISCSVKFLFSSGNLVI